MSDTLEEFFRQVDATPTRLVLVLSGGSGAVGRMLRVPGASSTLLEATVPYSQQAAVEYLGGRPDQLCSSRTARAMAVKAYCRAVHLAEEGTPVAGVACSAALSSVRPKRGEHRIHVALQTRDRTVGWSLVLEKGRRSRSEEEQIAEWLVLVAVAAACGVAPPSPPDLTGEERVEQVEALATESWSRLLAGESPAVCESSDHKPRVVFPGAFNPLHVGHQRMIDIATEVLGEPPALEISVVNVDKPPLDYYEISQRMQQFGPDRIVWLTRAATFEEKSSLFPGATFVVGVDTLRRIGDARYHGHREEELLAALGRIASRGCRFLVFGRDMGLGFMRLTDLELPEVLRRICREVPPDVFREDISSTSLRRSGEQ